MNGKGGFIGIVFAAALVGFGYVIYRHEQTTALPVAKANAAPTLTRPVASNNLQQIQQQTAPISGAITGFITGLAKYVPGLPNRIATVPVPYQSQPTVPTSYPYAPSNSTPSNDSILDQTTEDQAYSRLDNPFGTYLPTYATETPNQSTLLESGPEALQSLDNPFAAFTPNFTPPSYGF